MAYIPFRHMCLHTGFLLSFWFALTPHAHAESPGQAHIYRLRDVTVTVPDALLHAGADHAQASGFFVTATASTLEAALKAGQLREQMDTSQNPCGTLYVFEQPAQTQQVTGLKVHALNLSVDGQPLWWVVPQRQADTGGTHRACALAADEPWTLFTQGLAHVSWLRADTDAAPVVWVDLRHAASELALPWTLDEAPDGPLGQGARACEPAPDRPARALTAAEVAQSVVWHSAVHHKRLALTFDACSTYSYGPFNPAVIAALEAEAVPATLFVGGHWAEMHGRELQMLAQNPLFEIGNHTYSHPHMRDLEPWRQAQELRWTQALIYDLTGVTPKMFRPPYGEVDDAMLREVARAGLTTVEYDLPAGDADIHVSPLKLTQWVVGKAQAGSIVIMHMNRPKNHTAEALPMIVRQLRAKGYTFCQMSDLLGGDGKGCR
jgi:peptidoglycan/xylan/chitin deacetylase (PgdA/CDA1 family)